MLRVSDIQEHCPGEMGGAVKKPQTSQTAFCHPGSLALGVQMLTSPLTLAAISYEKVELQDWPLCTPFP